MSQYIGHVDPISSAETDPVSSESRMLSSDDVILAQRIRAGDAGAFAELVAVHAESAMRVAYYILRSRDAAKDAVQQMFTAVWAQRERFALQRSIRSYVLSVTRNQAIGAVRHAVVEERHRETTLRGSAHDAAEPSTRAAAEVEDRATVAVLLGTLSDRRRQAVELRYMEQRSFAEIGSIMGLSPGAAKILVLRSLEALRRHVGALDVPPDHDWAE